VGGARNAAFREKYVKGDKEVEIGFRHVSTIAQFIVMWREMHE
jgi:hypothetical protein